MIDQRGTSIEYQAKAKHLELMYLISQTRNRSLREKYTRQATEIRYYIRALRFKDYLTHAQINRIYQCLVEIADLFEFPVNPNLPTVEQPQQGTTIIVEGSQGIPGNDGGGTDYSALNIVTDTTADEFAASLAYGAEWTYVVVSSSGYVRKGRVEAAWNPSSATQPVYFDNSTTDLDGDTSAVSFQVAIVSGNVRLIALVASGTWTVRGTRYLTPNGGILQITPSVLASGNILVGNSSNVATPVVMSGDGALSNTGVFAISSDAIVNADINASAAIAWSKLASGTTSRVVVTNSSTGLFEVSPITTTILGYLANVTSDIQSQINALSSGTFNGAVSTILTSNLTADRVLISNPAGKVAVSGVSVTNLNTLDTTTSITTQLAGKLNLTGGTLSGALTVNGATVLGSTLSVTGAATFFNNIATAGNLSVTGTAQVTGNLAANTTATVGTTLVVGGAATFNTTAQVTGAFTALGGVRTNSGVYLKTLVLDIGDWNMDSNASKSVAHGLGANYKKIKSISVIIRDDSDNAYHSLLNQTPQGGENGLVSGTLDAFNSTNIVLRRLSLALNGWFDGTAYDSTGYNRGWITITYEA